MIAARPAPLRGKQQCRSKLRSGLLQATLVLVVLAFIGWLAHATLAHMRARGIQTGFDFLSQPAGFAIGEGWLSYDAGDPYWRAFLAGLVNTLRAALPAMVISTVLGTALAMASLSANPLLRWLARGYVEIFRNIPLLLQLLTWYLSLIECLPAVDQPWSWAGCVWLSKEGLALPAMFAHGSSMPHMEDGHLTGGTLLSPEYLAVLIALSTYTASYIAELVRGSIQAVVPGQREAAAALGLSAAQSMRRVVLPQALRVLLPPLGNQYLNLTKNSSLAVAVGYPDLVSIANTSLNQSGRAVECIAIIMLVYWLLSLLTSGLINAWNRHATAAWR